MKVPRFTTILGTTTALLILALPVGFGAYETLWHTSWQDSPRFDGRRYVLGGDPLAVPTSDATKAASVLALLRQWQGHSMSVEEVLQSFETEGAPTSLAEFRELAALQGFEGRWVESGVAALGQLKLPLVAGMRHDGGSLLIVRRVHDAYVYARDPGDGDVLYRLEDFDTVWTGRALVFPDPPDQPEEWR